MRFKKNRRRYAKIEKETQGQKKRKWSTMRER
jgi:hypothetical protein